MEFAGEFETHLTVDLPARGDMVTLRELAIARGLSCVHILLDRGVTPSQPMLTRRDRGRLSDQLAAARQLSETLVAHGWQVRRIKIEAAPGNQEIPCSECDVQGQPPGCYWEHHLKVLMAMGEDRASLTEMALAHGAHLSRNALRQRRDGKEERFLTQRCRLVGRAEATARLEALRDAVTRLGFQSLSAEQEYVVFDSREDLDAGWIEQLRLPAEAIEYGGPER